MPSTFHPWKNEKTHLQQPKTLKHPPLCKECKLNISKYTCPGCSVPSRSLPCVEAHKQHTRCTGKRQWTQFVPLSQFDDNLLLSVMAALKIFLCSTWTIEWRFHSTDIVLLNRRVNENSTLSSVIENHLKPGPWNHKLRSFWAEQLDCLKFFIHKYLKVSNPCHQPELKGEGDFSKEVKYEERIDRADLGRVFPAEELEEGEIPGAEQLNAHILFGIINII
ncbi:hypothetical protein CK203_082035 [Vitis vinifera]|uniref:HIT-type domain-containing protein n=1 Tax=Vitis vinifera TaxID=29760 RepID=A0A438BWF6_VITVI|nr:hypothetical protein CK203_082035 [Vitis vinifera]